MWMKAWVFHVLLGTFMETPSVKRLIPSIYTADGQATTADTRHVNDYNQAMNKALEYEAAGASELIFMDVTSISERRRNLPRFLKDLKNRLQIPFVFGGGVHTIRDVEDLLKYGAPRIYVNSAAVRYPDLVNKISTQHGKQALLVAIDTRLTFGSWKVYLNGGKSRTEIDLYNWIRMIEVRGAGEILVSAINRGDHEIVFDVFRKIREATDLSVLASAGFQSVEEYERLFKECRMDGVVSAHFFQKENSLRELKAAISTEIG